MFKNILIGVIIFIITSGLGIIATIGWFTYDEVKNVIPQQIEKANMKSDNCMVNLKQFENEQLEKHQELNRRDDISADNYSQALLYFIQIDRKLNIQLDFQRAFFKKSDTWLFYKTDSVNRNYIQQNINDSLTTKY